MPDVVYNKLLLYADASGILVSMFEPVVIYFIWARQNPCFLAFPIKSDVAQALMQPIIAMVSTTSVRYLGTTLDQTLSFSEMANLLQGYIFVQK